MADLTDAAILDSLGLDPEIHRCEWRAELDRERVPRTWTVRKQLLNEFGIEIGGGEPAVLPLVDEPGELARRPAFLVEPLGLDQLLEHAELIVGVEDGEIALEADEFGVAAKHLREVFDSQVAVFLADSDKRLHLQRGEQLFFEFDPKEAGVAQWVFEHNERAGLGSDTLPGSNALYLPMVGSGGPIGVVAVRPSRATRLLDPDQLHLLESLVSQVALAIERTRLSEEAQRAHVQAETERMRNAILSSVSHDLRTPLATITGAAGSLLHESNRLDPAARQELIRSIHQEADRLDQLLRNLLDMMRLEAGALHLNRDWHPLEEVAGSALARMERRLSGHRVVVAFPEDLPLLFVDGVLLQQVVINLLGNALKFTEHGEVVLKMERVSEENGVCAVRVSVKDTGIGIPKNRLAAIFDPFEQADSSMSRRFGGTGLGLTICRRLVTLMGGKIAVESEPGQGSCFYFTVKLERIATAQVGRALPETARGRTALA